jgi:RNA polymerase sigma-70 factor (ECF subfamily)
VSDPADAIGTIDAVLLAAVRAGDEDAFRSLTEPFVRELRLHCYRMLGSLFDAEDALQETLVRAWRHIGRFDGRSLRAWLYRIATNVCLSAAVRRRTEDEPLRLTAFPDSFLDELPSSEAGPASRYDLQECVQLAFLASIQLLPPRQRAVLLLRDVLAFSASEVADQLDVSVASVNGALQRARGSLDRERREGRLAVGTRASSDVERSLLRRFMAAWQAVDIDGLVALLKEDAVLTMPPFPMRFVGRGAIGEFLARVPAGGALDRIRLVPIHANRQPAVAAYMLDAEEGTHRAYGLMVLALDGEVIAEITGFSDPSLFSSFGLPMLHETED